MGWAYLRRIGPWRILLTPEHAAWAEAIAHRRNQWHLQNQYGLTGYGLAEHILGCLGELAAAILLGLPWPAHVDTFRRGFDVGIYQIRTRSECYQELYARDRELAGPYDHSDEPHILVNCIDERGWPAFAVRGWALGRDVKRLGRLEDFADRGAPLWVLKHRHLRVMDDLPPCL